MGQKVNPTGFRIGNNKLPGRWKSVGHAEQPAQIIGQDYKIRKILSDIYPKGQISEVIIERKYDQSITISIYAKKSSMIIGKGNKNTEVNKEAGKPEKSIDLLRKQLSKTLLVDQAAISVHEKIGDKSIDNFEENITTPNKLSSTGISQLIINIYEVNKPDLSAQLLAETIASQIENRSSHKTVMKRAINNACKQGAKGIMIKCSGRLGGAELARSERYREGRIPLHTLRANIDYAFTESLTTYGKIGVKVWIYT